MSPLPPYTIKVNHRNHEEYMSPYNPHRMKVYNTPENLERVEKRVRASASFSELDSIVRMLQHFAFDTTEVQKYLLRFVSYETTPSPAKKGEPLMELKQMTITQTPLSVPKGEEIHLLNVMNALAVLKRVFQTNKELSLSPEQSDALEKAFRETKRSAKNSFSQKKGPFYSAWMELFVEECLVHLEVQEQIDQVYSAVESVIGYGPVSREVVIQNDLLKLHQLLKVWLPGLAVIVVLILGAVFGTLHVREQKEQQRQLVEKEYRESFRKIVDQFRERFITLNLGGSFNTDKNTFMKSFSASFGHNHLYSFYNRDEKYCEGSTNYESVNKESIELKCREYETAILDGKAVFANALHDDRNKLAVVKDSEGYLGAVMNIPCFRKTDVFHNVVEAHVRELSVVIMGFDGDHYSVLIPTPDGHEYLSFFLPVREIDQEARLGYKVGSKGDMTFVDLNLEEYQETFAFGDDVDGVQLPDLMKEILCRLPHILKKHYLVALEKGLSDNRVYGYIFKSLEQRGLVSEQAQGKRIEVLQKDFDYFEQMVFQHYSVTGRHDAIAIQSKNILVELNNHWRREPTLSRRQFFEYWDRLRRVKVADRMLNFSKDRLRDIFLPTQQISHISQEMTTVKKYPGGGVETDLINTVVSSSWDVVKPVFYYRSNSQLIAGSVDEAILAGVESRYLSFYSEQTDTMQSRNTRIIEFYRDGELLFVMKEEREMKTAKNGVVNVFLPHESSGELEIHGFVKYSIAMDPRDPIMSEISMATEYHEKNDTRKTSIPKNADVFFYLSTTILNNLQAYKLIPNH